MVYTVCSDPNGTVDVHYFKEITVYSIPKHYDTCIQCFSTVFLFWFIKNWAHILKAFFLANKSTHPSL